jgi:hypothetical protein
MGTARGFLGAGDVYIERFDPDTQVYLAPKGPYESTKFAIKATTKLEEMTGRGRSTYGQILASVAIPQPTEFEIAVAEVNKDAMALAMLGTTATYIQASATVVDEVITAAPALGEWVKLAKHSLTAGSVVVTNSAASTTYTEGTHYEINYSLGWFRAVLGSTITPGQSLKIDYAVPAINGVRIRGVTQPQLKARFNFDGINMADGSRCIVECYEAVISSSAAFDFLAAKFNEVPLTGRLTTPVGKTEPFEVRLPTG